MRSGWQIAALCLGVLLAGMFVGRWVGDSGEQRAFAAPISGEGFPLTVYKGAHRTIQYTIRGGQAQKALHISEVAVYPDVLVFRDGTKVQGGVSLWALEKFQIAVGE